MKFVLEATQSFVIVESIAVLIGEARYLFTGACVARFFEADQRSYAQSERPVALRLRVENEFGNSKSMLPGDAFGA